MKRFLCLLLVGVVLCCCSCSAGYGDKASQESKEYEQAKTYYQAGDYDAAKEIFVRLDYADSQTLALDCDYQKAKELMNKGEYSQATALLDTLGEYLDAADLKCECTYQTADACLEDGRYSLAATTFDMLGDYKDSNTKRQQAMYQYVKANYNRQDRTTSTYLTTLAKENYKDSSKLDAELYAWSVVTAISPVSENAELLGEPMCPDDICLIHFPSMDYYCPVGVRGNETGAPTLHIDVNGGRPDGTALLTVIVARYDLKGNLLATQNVCTNKTVKDGDHFTSAYTPINGTRSFMFKEVVFSSIRQSENDKENIQTVETIFYVD